MDLATRLREREFAAVRVQLEADLRENLLKSLDERGGAQELVRQQYSGRYPFELLQNANDAAVDVGAEGRACFLLTDTALIVADDGSGFGDRQVDAICSLGRSSKGPGTAVGHKGLGFKSVGEITDRPQVLSAQASFQFDGERLRRELLGLLGTLPAEQRFPVYAFPFPVAEADLGSDVAQVRRLHAEGFRTIIRLPLREGVDRRTVSAHLVENLRPRLLLFLPGIDRLDLHGTLSDFSATVVRRKDGGAEHVVLDADGTIEEWLIYRSEATPERRVLEPLGEAWTKLMTVRWAVAVPLDEASQPRTGETFPLHVYFPTEEVPGLHVMVHAEWVLGMDRRQLAATPEAEPYNQMLLAHVVELLENHVAVDLVVRSGASATAVGAIVPAARQPSAGAGAQLRQLWEEALRRTHFLPVVDGSLAKPADVSLLPPRLPSLAQAHALAVLDGSRTLRPDIEEFAATKEFLMSGSVRVMRADEFLAHLRPPSRDSIDVYYGFLLNWRDQIGQQLVTALRMTPCVLTTSGQLVKPAEQPVFFPRGRSDSSIPTDIPVPIAEVPPIEGIEGLLRDLGVRPFEWRELIRDFLVKILADPGAAPDERLRAMSGLRAYHQVRRLSGSEELAPVLGRVLVPARSADGKRRELRAGAEVYFGADWTRSNDLETLYGPFGRAEFLDVEVPQDSDRRQVDMDFYRMFGVADHPRLDEAKPAEAYGYMVGHYRHPHRGPLFDEWMAQPHVREAAQCPQGHPLSQQLRLSYRMDRHLDLIENRDPHRLFALWRQLAQRWGAIYEPAMEAVFRCVHGSHSGDRDRTCESLFAYTLHSRPWVPVARGTNTDVVRPGDAWVDATDTPGRIKDRIPRIAETMYEMRGGAALVAALGLTDAGRPKVKDLLALLHSIAAEADELDDTDTNREIELAARYVQRTLDDVLGDEPKPHPAPETVRVLASHNGQSTFVAQPPVADDPLLRDTWEREFPVLNAEARLNRLVRYLSLTKLDNAVATSAMPHGHHFHDVLFTAVHSLLDDVKPYLLALVRAENPRAESNARNALKRLELVICDSLVLRYEYAGVTVEREDAVCYIATRPERRNGRTYQIGTAYLELDPAAGAPHWFAFGRQLAQHLGAPALADAVTMLLTAKADDRQRMMVHRQIQPEDITEAREQLGLTVDDDAQGNILDSLLSQVDRQPPAPPVNTTVAPPPPPIDPPSGPTPVVAQPTGAPSESPAAASLATVDYQKVRIIDGQLGQFVPPTAGNSQSWAGGGTSTAPYIQSEAEKRQIGKRGEEVVFHKERERLREAGKSPDLVVWVSKDDELAPFDIQSVDTDDQVIYIEVKSTKADNPEEPFYLSQAELLEASLHGSRYYIYRVTNAAAEAPTITRVVDPLRKVKEGRGHLLLDRARMTLTFSNPGE
ncbi:sacsin N-terminal ATP-binding-like domain-containing protein [Micromonospora chalcea]